MNKMLLIIACFVLLGCERDGKMAEIYHNGKLAVTTQCNDRVLLKQTPDTLEVYIQHYAAALVGDIAWNNIEQYAYVNYGRPEGRQLADSA